MKRMSQRSCRNCAVLVSGFSVFAMMALNPHKLEGAGENGEVTECGSLEAGLPVDTPEVGQAPVIRYYGAKGQQPEDFEGMDPDAVIFGMEQEQKKALEKQKAQEQKEEKEREEKQEQKKALEKQNTQEQKEGKGKEEKQEKDEKQWKEEKQGKDREKQGKEKIKENYGKPEAAQNKEEGTSGNQGEESVALCASIEPMRNEVRQEPLNPYGDISVSDEDYEAILRIVQAEAGGEDMQGKTLVAEVILNRVLTEGFASTIYDVVFERSGGSPQFAPTADGRYYTVEVMPETVEAVEQAFEGADLSQGALFFSARRRADPNDMAWFDRNLKWLFQYGGHEFYTLP